MTNWSNRSNEEQALLNPSYCSCILWHAATGYRGEGGKLLPLHLAFLILPMVLHSETRNALPRAVTTSLAVWLAEKPLSRGRIADHARSLASFSREGLIFGGIGGLLDVSDKGVGATDAFKRTISKYLAQSTNDIRTCASKATFVGRWLAKAGPETAVMAILGVRP